MSGIQNFTVQKKLGEGSFSEVYQVTRKSDNAIYAMKKVKMQKLSSKEKENALNEVRILASINHPNVIGYKEAFFEDATNSLCIVMENADGGDVLQLITAQKKKNSLLSEKMIWHHFIQIVRGLKALHDLKICHRDIKCANLFLTKGGVVKLGDLNVSKVAKKGMLRTQTGTPYYACPEVWKDMPYDHHSDIWSLGCVLYEMITNQPPFRATTMKGLYTKVISGKYDPIGSQYSQDLKNILKSCLQVRSSERPNCDQILAMPGLLNHLTGTLNDIEALKEETESLLRTIKLPRNLGMITERLPAAQYDVNNSEQKELKRVASVQSTRIDDMVKELKEKTRLASAAERVRPTEKKPEIQVKPAEPKPQQKVVAPVQISSTIAQKAQEIISVANQKHNRVMSLANRANRIAPVTDLPTIDEKAEETGVDNFKIGLKEKVKLLEPASVVPIPRKVTDLYRPQYDSQANPRSAEASIGKLVKLYREPHENSQKRDIGLLIREQEFVKGSQLPHDSQTPLVQSEKMQQLRAVSQNMALPTIKSHRPSAEVPIYSSKERYGGLPKPKLEAQAILAQRVINDNNYQHLRRLEMPNDVSKPLITRLSPTPVSERKIERPYSLQKHLEMIQKIRDDGEDEDSVHGFRAMLKRHQESHLSHVERIRKNLPSAQQARVKENVEMPDSLEVMRIKNQQAIQRALRHVEQQNLQNVYKPSVQALRQYSPYKPTLEDLLEKRGNRRQQPVSQSNIISEAKLRELHEIM